MDESILRALERLAHKAHQELVSVPSPTSEWFDHGEDSGAIRQVMFLTSRLATTTEWKSVQELLDSHAGASRHLGHMVSAGGSGRRCDLDSVLCTFLYEALWDGHLWVYSTSRVTDLARDLIRYFNSATLTVTCTCPVFGVNLECGTHYVNPDTVLESIDSQAALVRLETLFGRHQVLGFEASTMLSCHTFVRTSRAIPKTIGVVDKLGNALPFYTTASEAVDVVVAALQLVSEAHACAPYVCVEGERWWGMSGIHTSLTGVPFVARFTKPALSKDQCCEVLNVIRQLESEASDTPLARAIRWFGKARLEHNIEDRLVDLMVAAEALFLSDGNNLELGYRLSLRVAALLRSLKYDPLITVKAIKTVYDLRSKVVHGSSFTKPFRHVQLPNGRTATTLRELLDGTDLLLRQCILKELALPVDQRLSVNHQWDRLILDST